LRLLLLLPLLQIPQKLERLCGKGLQLEHAFGR
jgi:hypothetical protein